MHLHRNVGGGNAHNLTLNGAAAISRADKIGSIEPGKQADILILHFDSIDSLPYYVGMNTVDCVIARGEVDSVIND